MEAISERERQAFLELGLQPGDWAALYPLPLIMAAWQDRVLEKEEVLRLRPEVQAMVKKRFPANAVPPHVHSALEKLMLVGQARDEELRKIQSGLDLFCWHLKKSSWRERDYEWDQLRVLGARTLAGQDEVLDAILDELRERTDHYLPLDQFKHVGECTMAKETDRDRLQRLGRNHDWFPRLVLIPARLVLDRTGENRLSGDKVEKAFRDIWSAFVKANDSARAPTVMEELKGVRERRDQVRAFVRDEETRFLCYLAKLGHKDRECTLTMIASIAEGLIGEKSWNPLRNAPRIIEDEVLAVCRDQLRDRLEAMQRGEVPGQLTEKPMAPPPMESLSTAPPPMESLSTAPPLVSAPLKETVEKACSSPLPNREMPFTTVPIAKALAEIHEFWQGGRKLECLSSVPLLFEKSFLPDRKVILVRPDESLPSSLWFVGDLHGDLLALANAWHYIRRCSQHEGKGEPHVLFLGDFVDRGPYGHETLLYLFRLIHENPGRIGVLVGNHDEFQWSSSDGRFHSPVSPAEFAEDLNERIQRGETDSIHVQVGRHARTFFADRPRAIFLPDGLLVAHGGFPHVDLLETLHEPADLGWPECLSDFVWLRVSNAPRKRPNRSSHGCQFGFENFSAFCRRAKEVLGIPVERLLRGHDHVVNPHFERYEARLDWANPVLTLNTMCRRLDAESAAVIKSPYTIACVGRHVPGSLPEIHALHIDQQTIKTTYYGEAAT